MSGNDQRRREILAMAADLFERRGYHQTSMEHLAAAAGISKPTLYHYFRGKQEILNGIHQAFITPLIERHEYRLKCNLTASQRLLEVMGDILELMESHAGYVRVFFEHHRELDPDQRAVVVRQRSHYRAMVRDDILEGIRHGEFREVDADMATLGLFGMCNWAYQWFRPSGRLAAREVAYEMWSLLALGLLPRTAPTEDGDASTPP